MVEAFYPSDLQEALNIRSEKKALPFAGGTDLMVKYRSWSSLSPAIDRPALFIDKIKDLQTLFLNMGILSIGAGVTLARICSSRDVPEILARAAESVAAPAIRNRATIGGNICNASPAGDTLPPLYALDSKIKIASKGKGERIIPIEEFIKGPGKTSLEDDELALEIIIPDRYFPVSCFRKVGTRKANALSKLSFTAIADLRGNKVLEIRIAFGAVGPTVVRSRDLEKTFEGKTVEELKEPQFLEKILKDYSQLINPISDQRSTSEYRKKVCLNLLRSFLEKDLGSPRGGN